MRREWIDVYALVIPILILIFPSSVCGVRMCAYLPQEYELYILLFRGTENAFQLYLEQIFDPIPIFYSSHFQIVLKRLGVKQFWSGCCCDRLLCSCNNKYDLIRVLFTWTLLSSNTYMHVCVRRCHCLRVCHLQKILKYYSARSSKNMEYFHCVANVSLSMRGLVRTYCSATASPQVSAIVCTSMYLTMTYNWNQMDMITDSTMYIRRRSYTFWLYSYYTTADEWWYCLYILYKYNVYIIIYLEEFDGQILYCI